MIHLTPDQTALALKLWREGRDTLQIAKALNSKEEAVYNSLAKIRGGLRLVA